MLLAPGVWGYIKARGEIWLPRAAMPELTVRSCSSMAGHREVQVLATLESLSLACRVPWHSSP